MSWIWWPLFGLQFGEGRYVRCTGKSCESISLHSEWAGSLQLGLPLLHNENEKVQEISCHPIYEGHNNTALG